MFDILKLNAISPVGLAKLPKDEFKVSDDTTKPNGIILRSYDMHSMELPDSLLAVARAGAGTNNIPKDVCSEKGIVVFNTPGANANAVKEIVLCALLLSSRKIVQGIEWTKTLAGQADAAKQVEKGKKQFVGPEIMGKTLGIIGLGATGTLIANAAINLGMNVIGYDPFLNVDTAWNIDSHVHKAASVEEVVANSNYITMHVPLTDQTKNMFNAEMFDLMQKDTRLLNFSRDGLVDIAALKDAMDAGTIACYVTDLPTPEVLALDKAIAVPHLGASTPEAEQNCAAMAAMELSDFLKYGNIRHSVNYPDCTMPYTEGKARVSIINKNIPNMIGSIANVFAKENLNIDNMINKSKGDWAYTLIDLDTLSDKGAELLEELNKIEGVVKTRIVIEN